MKHLLSDLSRRALISDEQAALIVGQAAEGRDTEVRLLLRQGLVDQQVLATELGRVFDLPIATRWPSERVLPDAISLRFMRERHVLPVSVQADTLAVIVSDPSDEATLAALRLASGRDLSLSLGTDNQILSAIERLDEGRADAGQASESFGTDDDDTLKDLALDAPVIDLVNRLFREASAARATDLHIEPARGYVIVRHRVDGLLEERERLSSELGRAAVSRLKILTNLNIAEKRLPQDGRATMPTIHGESIAIRFLSSNTQAPDINRLGLSPPDLAKVRQQIQHAHGMIVVTGPTGSGKTTTLAAVLGVLNDPRRKIVTIEDPVEYQVEGVNQIQIHSEIGLSFARTLRSLLRFDPDIIMVGEMRDSETASIGVNAALTGHLVLTTLHTNSAAGAVIRLLDLGVQAYLIASTLRCVVAQRLVRKLCIHCREPYEATPDLLAQLPDSAGASGNGAVTLYRACGCTYCGNTGFSGRAAIFEVMVIDDHVRRLIKPGVSADIIAMAARKAGTPSMMSDGFAKCREGLTTIEELGRVTSED